VSDRRTLAAFLAAVLFAGLNPVAVRVSNAELAPFWGAGFRFLLAAGVFWLIVIVRRRPLPRGRAWLGPIAYGFLAFALFFTLVYWGLQQAHATTGAVALALVPLLTLLLAVVQRQEPYRARGLLGAAVSVAGIAIVFGDQLGGAVSLASLLALVAAAAAAAEAGIVVRWFPRSDPFVTNAIGMTVGVVVLLALSVMSGEVWAAPTRSDTWVAFAYMVTFGSVGVFWLSLRVLREWPASRASYQFLLMPLVTVVVAAVLVGETPSVVFLVGGAVALLGVYVGAFWGRPALAPPPARPAAAGVPGTRYAVVEEQPLPNC
jgi:drug/metabolite transporter (DMT)-like permease